MNFLPTMNIPQLPTMNFLPTMNIPSATNCQYTPPTQNTASTNYKNPAYNVDPRTFQKLFIPSL